VIQLLNIFQQGIMDRFKRYHGVLLIFISLILCGCSYLNSYQDSGELILPGLKEPVTVLRDEKGMAYIYASSMEDAIMAQGFVTAQDRLFQMELVRLVAEGRICELAGEEAKSLAVQMKTIGFLRNAKKHAEIIDVKARSFMQKYLDGVNAFITLHPKEHPLEFKLAGIEVTPWHIEDSLAVAYFMSWGTAANLGTEIIAQMLLEKLGVEKAMEIFPLNINPDEAPQKESRNLGSGQELIPLPVSRDKKLLAYLKDFNLRLGSNNWCVGPKLSAGGKPIVADDPHLDSRILPGPWYPSGLITPEFRAVGVTIPGIPGIFVGRTDHVAFGVTNAYGDNQDLYVETLDPKDPERYLEGDRSFPFESVVETLRIKDGKAAEGFRAEKLKIRLTHRGPVISGLLTGLKTQKVMTLRWAPFERMDPSIGFQYMLSARSVPEFRGAVKSVNILLLNFGFADDRGNIGWQVSGRIPIRAKGDGTIPYVVKGSEDDWVGYVPSNEMPHALNPDRGWVGTCNHDVIKRDYPYYYSSHFSPSYRYQRVKQLLEGGKLMSADDHWQYQRDTMNLMAEKIAPVMAKALLAHEETRKMGEILSTWDYRDDPDKAAPAVFQAVYRQFALLVYEDELGEELAKTMLEDWYFWQERLQAMVLEGSSLWFDNVKTAGVKETRDDIFYQAALKVSQDLSSSLGKDPAEWRGGKVHRIEFVSPIRRKGFGKGLLGSGPRAAPGSGETLNRGMYDFNEPFEVTIFASLRMVADLSDNDKVLAVLPGGVCGRLFHPHTKDQVEAFMRGDKVYWWFSDKAIEEHAKTKLELMPH
jgi:penicillin amidase